MSGAVTIGASWLLFALVIGLLMGRAIHSADVMAGHSAGPDGEEPTTAVDLPAARALPASDVGTSDAAGESPADAPPVRDERATIPGIPAPRAESVALPEPSSSRHAYRESGLP